MKSPKSLYSRLALLTSVTLVVGYFVVYAVYQNIESVEVGPGATITTSLMTKIKDNFDNISSRVTTLEGSIAGASVWSKVGSDINYTAGKVGIGTASPNKSLHLKTTTGTNAELDIQSEIKPHWGIYHDETTEELRFWNGANRVVFGSGGSVGIGMSNPGLMLGVGANSFGRSGIEINATAENAYLTLNRTGDVASLVNKNDGTFRINHSASSTDAHIVIDTVGNVGIGMVPTTGNGVLQVKDGVAFPATQVPVANPNTLDDYEEGTWTPVLGGYATQGSFASTGTDGFYIKIGRKVTVWFRAAGTITGASADYLTVSGLPFTVASAAGGSSSAGGSISYMTGLDMGVNGRGWFMYPQQNTTRAIVGVITQNSATTVNPNTTINIYGTITYYTAN